MDKEKGVFSDAEKLISQANKAYDTGHYANAIVYMSDAVKIYRKANCPKEVADQLSRLGVMYSVNGNDYDALDCYMESIDIAKEYNLMYILCKCWNNIGSMYQASGHHRHALTFFHNALNCLPQIREQEAFEKYAVISLIVNHNLCISYMELKDMDLAGQYLQHAQKIQQVMDEDTFTYTLKITELRLMCRMGRVDEVRAQVPYLVSQADEKIDPTNYEQEMEDICNLLEELKAFQEWETVLRIFDKGAQLQENNTFYKLNALEAWMRYFKAMDKEEEYNRLCIEYMKYYLEQKDIARRSKGDVLDLKMQIFTKEKDRKKAKIEANTDKLTGLFNRDKLEHDMRKLLSELAESQRTMYLGMIDIDHFKAKNDTYGHVEGDDCLIKVAEVLHRVVGNRGRVYRYGGDEFILVLPDVSEPLMRQIAEDMRDMITYLHIPNINSSVCPEVTISQGYKLFSHMTSEMSMNELIQEADQVLYLVKESGRNGYKIK